jgi:hypothetical protein
MRSRARRRLRLIAVAVLVWTALDLAGCTATPPPGVAIPDPSRPAPLVAVFPVENLTGGPAPLADIRRLFIERVLSIGLRVLDDATLEGVVTRHRVRYMGGVEIGFSKALAQETGAEGILIPSLELYEAGSPPKVALFARLVSTGETPTVRWIDGTGAAGDDSFGFLGLRVVDDPGELLAGRIDILARSLARYVSQAGGRVGDRPVVRKFQPKIVYRSDEFDPARTYSIAVVPFFNKSPRARAGEIVALHMIRNLMTVPALEVVEPGIVREELLRFRIIMNEGISLPQTETILGAVNADLVLNGEVLEYRDPPGGSGSAAVDLAVVVLERRTRRLVYSSYSYNTGTDGVFFFDLGQVNTAHAMTSQMARAIAERMARGAPKR